MDWLKSGLAAAQKQAEDAAARMQENARALVEQAQNTNFVQQAKVLAEQATEKAKARRPQNFKQQLAPSKWSAPNGTCSGMTAPAVSCTTTLCTGHCHTGS